MDFTSPYIRHVKESLPKLKEREVQRLQEEEAYLAETAPAIHYLRARLKAEGRIQFVGHHFVAKACRSLRDGTFIAAPEECFPGFNGSGFWERSRFGVDRQTEKSWDGSR